MKSAWVLLLVMSLVHLAFPGGLAGTPLGSTGTLVQMVLGLLGFIIAALMLTGKQ